MAWFECTGGSGGGGGGSITTVLTGGQVSTLSDYATAYFNDISAYENLFIRFYFDNSGITINAYTIVRVSDIPASGALQLYVYASGTGALTVSLTRTSIGLTSYAGSWRNIYADLKATDLEIF